MHGCQDEYTDRSFIIAYNIKKRLCTDGMQPFLLEVGKIATIGFFDGMHEGHRYVISQVTGLANQRAVSSVVFTFRNHPASLFSPKCQPKLLSTAEEKEMMLYEMKVGNVVMLDFSKELAATSVEDFLVFIRDGYGVDTLLLGYDNNFGRKGEETRVPGYYESVGEKTGVLVKRLEAYGDSSSTKIRKLLDDGDVLEANKRLLREYTMCGNVVCGYQVGREIGFPTANISVPPEKLIPKAGVYAAHFTLDGRQYKSVVNIGTRPTFGRNEIAIEAHVIGFDGDIYNKCVAVGFAVRLRDERKFGSVEDLIDQIKNDVNRAVHLL
ncbi:MAG: riboflavin biosynthesis protein RibF [Bacteroidaceae bacterium]|nr:riboflavin biosynthesis protein RibF [Bacteroidaceae bacterium]